MLPLRNSWSPHSLKVPNNCWRRSWALSFSFLRRKSWIFAVMWWRAPTWMFQRLWCPPAVFVKCIGSWRLQNCNISDGSLKVKSAINYAGWSTHALLTLIYTGRAQHRLHLDGTKFVSKLILISQQSRSIFHLRIFFSLCGNGFDQGRRSNSWKSISLVLKFKLWHWKISQCFDPDSGDRKKCVVLMCVARKRGSKIR